MNRLLYIVAIILTAPLYSEIGCMDKSKHAHWWNKRNLGCHPVDNKTLDYVHCTCPCNRYSHDAVNDRCSQCWHYRFDSSRLS